MSREREEDKVRCPSESSSNHSFPDSSAASPAQSSEMKYFPISSPPKDPSKIHDVETAKIILTQYEGGKKDGEVLYPKEEVGGALKFSNIVGGLLVDKSKEKNGSQEVKLSASSLLFANCSVKNLRRQSIMMSQKSLCEDSSKKEAKDKENVLARNLLAEATKNIILHSRLDENEINEDYEEAQSRKSHIIEEFREEVKKLSEEKRYERAAMFFREAVFSRQMRYLFSSNFIQSVYNIHGNPIWSDILCYMVWLYMLLTFFEPSHSSDRPFISTSWKFYTLMSCEILFICFFLFDETLDIILRYTDLERTKTQHFLKNKKFLIHVFIDFVLIFDIICFYSCYSQGKAYFRIGRLARPAKLVFYSGETRRWLKSILNTWKNLIDIFILFTITILIFALIGIKILSDPEAHDKEYISNENNMTNFGGASFTLYILTTLSNYPAAIIPYCKVSNYYFFYFLPFMYIILMFFVPIPVAVVFDQFRDERTNLLKKDRIREKEALYAVHVCLDFEGKGFITEEQWNLLCRAIYRGDSHKEMATNIYAQFDINNDGDLDVLEFFDACELIICMKDIQTAFACNPPCWHAFRMLCNKKLKLQAIVNSRAFEIFIMLVIFVNIIVLIIGEVAPRDSETAKTCEEIDSYILFIYVLEIIMKIIGLGAVKYFSDPWNKLDFALVFISFIIQATISFLKMARYPKGLKALKASNSSRKTSKGLKAAKAMKGAKACRCLRNVLSPFTRIKAMIMKVFLNISTINNMVSLMILLFYFYGVIGIEIYHPNIKGVVHSEFESSIYAEFNEIGAAMIGLFQISTQSSWHAVVLHYAENYNFTGAIFYFFSFHMITVMILLNLTSGLIWEVFTIVSEQVVSQALADETEEAESGSGERIHKEGNGHKNINRRDNNTLEVDPGDPKNNQILLKEELGVIPEENSDNLSGIEEESLDSVNIALTPDTPNPFTVDASNKESRDLNKIAENLGGGVSSKLYLRGALLKGADIDELKKKEAKAISAKFSSGKVNKFIDVITHPIQDKVFHRKLDKICMTLLRHLRSAERAKEIVQYINQSLSTIMNMAEGNRGDIYLVLEEIEMKGSDEEGIITKLCNPCYTKRTPEVTDLSEIFEDIAQNNAEGLSTYTFKDYFIKHRQIPLFFLKASKIEDKTEDRIRKDDIYNKISKISKRQGVNMENYPLEEYSWDMHIENIKVSDESIPFEFFEESAYVGSALNQQISQPSNSSTNIKFRELLRNIILKKIYIIGLRPKKLNLKGNNQLPKILQMKGILKDIRDVLIPNVDIISKLLTKYFAGYEDTSIYDDFEDKEKVKADEKGDLQLTLGKIDENKHSLVLNEEEELTKRGDISSLNEAKEEAKEESKYELESIDLTPASFREDFEPLTKL